MAIAALRSRSLGLLASSRLCASTASFASRSGASLLLASSKSTSYRPVEAARNVPARRIHSSASAMSDAPKRQGPPSFDFPWHLDVQTRWLDNDQYGHLNNSAYYLIADSVINKYLVESCGIEPFTHDVNAPAPAKDSPKGVIGLIISSSAIYYASTSFPAVLRAGLRVIKLGTSSVTYEIGLFSLPPGSSGLQGDAKAAVVTQATHVFVDRTTRRPGPMPTQLREGLEKLVVKESKL